ncbi:MAG: serine/threonine-protein kinase [Polyangiaceae bacterium]|jgi:serine/threonine-protein kinase
MPLPDTGVRVLGRYALYDEIAAGGMATVHIGRLLGPVGFSRTVAIKRLHAQFAKDPDFVSMFLDEARLAARVRHPNVIGTLDIVSLAGELFLVMEYVPGESLARLWRTMRDAGRSIPVPIVAAVFVGVLEGLHAAHEATNDRGEPLGVVHRDVSPHNILVGTDGVARVLDFGVAKAFGRLQTTREGQLKGKISYMAPEQVQGIVDRTTDIYATSVALWESLVGKRLFFAENEARTLANVLYPKVEAPSHLVQGIPSELDEVVLRGLHPDPSRRYATARAMARALQSAVSPAPAFTVGEWVEATAGSTLATRASRVASVERMLPPDSDSYLPMTPSSIPPPISAVALRSTPGTIAEPSSSRPDLAAQPASEAAVHSAAPMVLGRPKRRASSAVAAAALMVALGAVVVVGVSVTRVKPGPHGVPLTGAVPVRDVRPAPTRFAVDVAPPAVAPPASATAESAASASASSREPPSASPRGAPAPRASAWATPSPPRAAPEPAPVRSTRPAGALANQPPAVPATEPAKPSAGEFDHVMDSRQ